MCLQCSNRPKIKPYGASSRSRSRIHGKGKLVAHKMNDKHTNYIRGPVNCKILAVSTQYVFLVDEWCDFQARPATEIFKIHQPVLHLSELFTSSCRGNNVFLINLPMLYRSADWCFLRVFNSHILVCSKGHGSMWISWQSSGCFVRLHVTAEAQRPQLTTCAPAEERSEMRKGVVFAIQENSQQLVVWTTGDKKRAPAKPGSRMWRIRSFLPDLTNIVRNNSSSPARIYLAITGSQFSTYFYQLAKHRYSLRMTASCWSTHDEPKWLAVTLLSVVKFVCFWPLR